MISERRIRASLNAEILSSRSAIAPVALAGGGGGVEALGGPFVPIQSERALAGDSNSLLYASSKTLQNQSQPCPLGGGGFRQEQAVVSGVRPSKPTGTLAREPRGCCRGPIQAALWGVYVGLRNAAGRLYQECPSPCKSPLFVGGGFGRLGHLTAACVCLCVSRVGFLQAVALRFVWWRPPGMRCDSTG